MEHSRFWFSCLLSILLVPALTTATLQGPAQSYVTVTTQVASIQVATRAIATQYITSTSFVYGPAEFTLAANDRFPFDCAQAV
jgi:hypothetical protein